MKCILLGTDKLGAAPRILNKLFGVTEVIHWSGRKKIPRTLPKDTKLIIVYSSFINHDHMFKVKNLAKSQGVTVKFVNRGLSELVHKEGVA
jgi:hypothetical protein